MPSRSALIVANAAGPETVVAGVLKRFDFTVPQHVPSVAAAIERMRARQVDLLFVPLDRCTTDELSAIGDAVQQGRALSVIGTAGAKDPDLLLRGMRCGISEFLVAPVDAEELAVSVARLVRRTPADTGRGKVIAVHASKGGIGNTTIAVNLAHELAQLHPGARVAIVDLVIAGGDVRVFLDVDATHHIGDLAGKLDRADAELVFSLLTPAAKDTLWVLPSPDDPGFEDAIDAAAVAGVIDRLRAHCAFVVVDCEHHMSERTLAAMDAADRIVLGTQLNVPALRSTQRSLAVCQRLGHAPEKLCVVVNRHQPSDVLSLEDASQVLTTSVFATLPNNYVIAFEALTHGVPIAQLAPGAPLAKGFASLAAKLAGTPPTSTEINQGGSRLGRLMGKIRRA